MVNRSCPTCTSPSPSQRPIEPPSSESSVDRWKGRKSVVVTFIVLEKVREIIEASEDTDSIRKRTSVWVVVQGRGQVEDWEPSRMFS